MDLSAHFMVEHSEHFVASRLAAGRTYSYGTGSFPVAMIGGMAAALRRAATAVEQWARGRDDASGSLARRLPSL